MNRQDTIVLFEDKGVADFFERLRPELGLESIRFEVGGGWTQTYTRYEEIAQVSNPRQIVPVLDADTITARPPQARAILENPNLFRFSRDFEWALDEWMLADAITSSLKEAKAQLDIADPTILMSLDIAIHSARLESWNTKTPIYAVLKAALSQWLTDHNIDPTAFPLPDKAWLAHTLGKRLAGLHMLPHDVSHEVHQLVCLIQHVAGLENPGGYDRAVWRENANHIVENTVRAFGLQGNILLTINNRLHILRLPQGSLSPFGPDEPVYSASWSPDYSKIAAQIVRNHLGTNRYYLAILSSDGDVLSEISQGVPNGGPTNPCWHPSDNSILVKHNGPVLSVTVDSERWSDRLGEDTGVFCQATIHCCARTVQGDRYSLELGRSWNTLSPVDGANDVRGHISWSHTGGQLAYTEYHLSGDRGCVAIVNKENRRPRVITPVAWSPYWVSWSPDDRFVAFSCLAEHNDRSLYVVDVNTGEARCLVHLTDEIVMGCRAWGS